MVYSPHNNYSVSVGIKTKILCLLVINSIMSASDQDNLSAKSNVSFWSQRAYIQRRNDAAQKDCKNGKLRFSGVIKRCGRDFALLHKNLFSWDTLKVAAVIVPSVAVAYKFDHKIHKNFYDVQHHKNVRQPPKWTRELARFITAPIIAGLGSQAFLSNDKEMRATSQVMLLGIPILIYVNELVRFLKFDICYRPWNGNFSSVKRTPGGFPSGHVSKSMYLAVLYGMRYGPKYAFPLGAMTAFIGTAFLAGNRHYLSQLIAGVGLGAIYGLAASKVVDYKLTHDCQLGFGVDPQGGPNLSISWRF
jgi:membrane-associated phospholipid phosphatase